MSSTVTRPGITPAFLADNEIKHVTANEAQQLCGCPESGLILPYRHLLNGQLVPLHDPGDRRYVRLRKDTSTSNKYHQPAGTAVHAYLPINLSDLRSDGDLGLVEGEFKALSLTDRHAKFSMPAIGLSGFFGYHLGQDGDGPLTLVPELAAARDQLKPRRILFLGDNDTTFNFAFVLAACRLKQLLPDRDVILPRIPLDQPKGIDDCRAQLGDGFDRFCRRLVDDAIPVNVDETAAALALRLATPAWETVEKFDSEQRALVTEKVIKWLARLPAAYREEGLAGAKKSLHIGITELRRQVKLVEQKNVADRQQELVEKIRPKIASYFCAGKNYVAKSGNGFRTIPTRQDTLLALQVEAGLASIPGGTGSEAEFALNLIQQEQRVDWAGSLAGYPSGVHKVGNGRILVVDDPTIIPAAPAGDATLIVDLLADLMGRAAGEAFYQQQITTLFSWLSRRRQALVNPGIHLPSQILVLVGEADIGKTVTQEHLTTPILGGRGFDPTDIWAGRSPFNDALFGCEHLVLSDPTISSDDDRARRSFQGALIRAVANEHKVAFKKFDAAQMLRPVQAVTISMNPTLEYLSLLPLHDRHSRDKFILLRCHRINGLPGENPNERSAFLARVAAALPVFVAQLDGFEVPSEYRDGRFGVSAFHHPDLLAEAKIKDSPWFVAQLLDKLIIPKEGMRLTARELHRLLGEQFKQTFLLEVPDARALGKLLVVIQRDVPGWAQRLRPDGKMAYGDQGNYAPAWRLETAPIVGS